VESTCISQVEVDESIDEMASYFNRETEPKILITTSDRPSQVRCLYCHATSSKHSLSLGFLRLSTRKCVTTFVQCLIVLH